MEKLEELIDEICSCQIEICDQSNWGENTSIARKRLEEAKEALKDYVINVYEGKAHFTF